MLIGTLVRGVKEGNHEWYMNGFGIVLTEPFELRVGIASAQAVWVYAPGCRYDKVAKYAVDDLVLVSHDGLGCLP